MSTPVLPEQALEAKANELIALGYRIESRTSTQIVYVSGKGVNHLLHFFIGLLTIGVWWLFVWLPLGIFGGEKRRIVTFQVDGTLSDRKL
jgi:hypothetical protein